MPYLVLGLAQGTGAPVPDTSLLIHSDTTNGSTTFIDSSPGGITLTANGNVQHTTSQAKFGASSIEFPNDGTGGNISTAQNNGFAVGAGDFTIDMWIYRQGNMNLAGLFSSMGYTGATGTVGYEEGIGILTTNNDPDGVYCYIGSSSSFEGPFTLGTIALNTWTHIAFIRESNVRYTAINGTVTQHAGTSSRVIDVPFASVGNRYFDGDNQPTYSLQGDVLLDEVRFSTVAQWNSNFTPPTAPYT